MAEVTRLVLPDSLWAEMETSVRSQYPEEACGILAGRFNNETLQAQAVFPLENILHSSRRFRIDPQQQVNCIYSIQSHKLEIIAVYHSHPLGGYLPSETDRLEYYDPHTAAVIWHPLLDGWDCRAYVLDTHQFSEIPVVIQREP